jgi:hypothetical protein
MRSMSDGGILLKDRRSIVAGGRRGATVASHGGRDSFPLVLPEMPREAGLDKEGRSAHLHMHCVFTPGTICWEIIVVQLVKCLDARIMLKQVKVVTGKLVDVANGPIRDLRSRRGPQVPMVSLTRIRVQWGPSFHQPSNTNHLQIRNVEHNTAES